MRWLRLQREPSHRLFRPLRYWFVAVARSRRLVVCLPVSCAPRPFKCRTPVHKRSKAVISTGSRHCRPPRETVHVVHAYACVCVSVPPRLSRSQGRAVWSCCQEVRLRSFALSSADLAGCVLLLRLYLFVSSGRLRRGGAYFFSF